MNWRWKDQGFGNRKGEIWLELVVIIIIIIIVIIIIIFWLEHDEYFDQVRGSMVVANCKKQFKKLAPHEMESRQMIIEDHPVITTAVSLCHCLCSCLCLCLFVAPHEMKSRQMIVEDHPVITTAVKITLWKMRMIH